MLRLQQQNCGRVGRVGRTLPQSVRCLQAHFIEVLFLRTIPSILLLLNKISATKQEELLQVEESVYYINTMLNTRFFFLSSVAFLIGCGALWFCILVYPQRRRLKEMIRVERYHEPGSQMPQTQMLQLSPRDLNRLDSQVAVEVSYYVDNIIEEKPLVSWLYKST